MISTKPNLVEFAKRYYELGWSTIPIDASGNRKQPAVQWRQFQQSRPTKEQIQRWFSGSFVGGIAVILGPVSANLYCRDFDEKEAYLKWKEHWPKWSETLPTVRTHRGYHVYFRCTHNLTTTKYRDGELRCGGAYTVLPPSPHAAGGCYEWLIEPTLDNLLSLNPADCGLMQFKESKQDNEEKAEVTERTELTERTERTEEDRSGIMLVKVLDTNISKVEDLVQFALPSEAHQSHVCLFYLARALKTYEKFLGRKANLHERRQILDAWYARSVAYLRKDQSKDDYFIEFIETYENAIAGLGVNTSNEAWEIAQKATIPRIAIEIFDSSEIRLFVTFCCELQRLVGDRPFFLSCRTVQRHFGLSSHTKAAKWLHGLVAAKILEVVIKGGPKTNKATRYKYLYPLEDVTPIPSSKLITASAA